MTMVYVNSAIQSAIAKNLYFRTIIYEQIQCNVSFLALGRYIYCWLFIQSIRHLKITRGKFGGLSFKAKHQNLSSQSELVCSLLLDFIFFLFTLLSLLLLLLLSLGTSSPSSGVDVEASSFLASTFPLSSSSTFFFLAASSCAVDFLALSPKGCSIL